MAVFEPVRAVIFDLDGTLRHNHPSFTRTIFDIAIRLGMQETSETRATGTRWFHYYWAQSEELLADLKEMGDQEEVFWTNHARRALIEAGCPAEQAADLAPQVYRGMTAEYKPEDCVFEDVPHALQSLRSAGYRLAVLSNRTKPYDEQLGTLGLAEYFEFALAAGALDSWKPEAKIFQHAVQRMDVPAQAVMYVGDNYYADVIGARNAGLQPVLVDPDGIFPDAECPVIHTLAELPRLLGV